MSNQQRVHPYFDNPPVVEVVCGLQFRPLLSMQAPYLGRLWSKFEKDFPRVHTMPPLLPVLREGAEIGFELGEVPPLPRIWFIQKEEEGLIQVQQDRFMYNWKRVDGGGKYPGFGSIIGKFRGLVDVFVDFLEEHNLGDVGLTQLELTYVDHIKKQGGWNDAADVGRVFPDFQWRSGERFLTPPTSINWRCEYDHPGNIGRLSTRLQVATLKGEEKEKILRFDMAVRGIPEKVEEEGVWEWFAEANQWISQAFMDLTSEEIQKNEWGRREC